MKADRGIRLRPRIPLDRGIQSGKGTDPDTTLSRTDKFRDLISEGMEMAGFDYSNTSDHEFRHCECLR